MKVVDLEPVFPGFDSRSRVVNVTGLITEHGTVTNVQVQGGDAAFKAYESSARAAVGLWRFDPATAGECGLPVFLSAELRYQGN